jgi:hypothetical protein
MKAGNDGWIAPLTQDERDAVATALKSAFPGLELQRIKEAADKLADVLENVRSLSLQESELNARQLRVLAKAGGEFEARLEKASRARIRFQKLLGGVPGALGMQLTERMMDRMETASESAALLKLGFSLSRFAAQLDDLERTLLVTRSLNRSFLSSRGARRKDPLKLLAIEIARTYDELSPRDAAGISADPYDDGKPTGARYKLAVAVFRAAFPTKKPPNGIIVAGFREFRDAQLKS